MPERPEAVKRLDDYLAAARIAHETIWELHNRLIALGRYDDNTRGQLLAAARIMSVDMDKAIREARRLRDLWSEQELLDPVRAEETLRALTAEMDRIAAPLAGMRQQQDEVARELLQRVRETK